MEGVVAEANEELIGLSLVWQAMTKRVWLAGPADPQGSANLRQAIKALDGEGDRVEGWGEFLDVAVRVFKDHGFTWVDN
jgi:hypothetical protein